MSCAVQTCQAGHGKQLAMDAALAPGVDGVLVVGGDGIVAEVVNGLLLAAADTAAVDVNVYGAQYPRPSVRLGIIAGVVPRL